MRKVMVACLSACALLGTFLTVTAASASAHGTVITTRQTAFGRALVVGSGKYAGFTLYTITSDHGRHFGCSSVTANTVVGPILCTGPSNDSNAEWPAITTTGAPIAAGGVQARLLGTVHRSFGTQVTYAGQPLYLFDRGPGQVTGMGWDEPGLPPWHGVWSLISPSGLALWWDGDLTTVKLGGQPYLAAHMLTAVGWENFPVYSFSVGAGGCTGACLRAWPAMLTSNGGVPAASGMTIPWQVGSVPIAAGMQATYGGEALYYFANEAIIVSGGGSKFRAAGNGNGVHAFGGVFRLVSP